jgi:hypothetical protein
VKYLLAFVLGFGLAYFWQHKPAQMPGAADECVQPAKGPLKGRPWPKVWRV